MYDINRQVCIVSDAMEAEKASQAYCREARAEKGLAPDDSLWIPSLCGSTAYRLGELCERTSQKWAGVMDICGLLDISHDLLVAAVKAIRRRGENCGRYDRVIHVCMSSDDDIRMMQFLCNRKRHPI